jgi:hypothetical protein
MAEPGGGSGLPVSLDVLILFPWDPGARRFLGEKIWFDRGSLVGLHTPTRTARMRIGA